MTSRVTVFRLWYATLCLCLAGCVPSTQTPSDEEKESHFLAGKSRVSTMDYKGAIESFDKAIELNPRSASAHFELACLYERETDPAAAIYHYTKYLKLRPEAGNSDIVKERINTCKQEIAREVSLGPLNERQQRELELLSFEKKRLDERVKQLSEQLDQLRGSLPTVPGASNRSGTLTGTGGITPLQTNPQRGSVLPLPVGTRTHTVKAGETLTAIARKYSVRLDTLMSANPSVDAKRLKVGQVLQIPPP